MITNADTTVAPNYSKMKRDNLWLLPESEQSKNFELSNRLRYAANELKLLEKPSNESVEEIERFWTQSKGSASSWFYYPRQFKPVQYDGKFFIEAGETFVAIVPVSGIGYVVSPAESFLHQSNSESLKFFKDYSLLVFPGKISGYIVETGEKSMYKTLSEFQKAILSKTQIDSSKLEQKLELTYHSLGGDKLKMIYRPEGLRCRGFINGKEQNWDQLTHGAVYESQYLKIKQGIMQVSDGKSGYRIDFTGSRPIYTSLK